MINLVGKQLGKYHIAELLGAGGMGEVYKAYHPGLSRYRAIKVIHRQLRADDDKFAEFVERFQREAAAASDLRHPNIVRVLDYDREGELHYMIMELVDGPTLEEDLDRRRAEEQPFTLGEIAAVFKALAGAIDYAHGQGVVHHDLKPANIMFTADGQVRLTDFGIARLTDAPAYTVTGDILGTLTYMSPEQAESERGDRRSDIYSLGVILYEMAVGEVPFTAKQPATLLYQHINQSPPPPSVVNPNIPKTVDRVILRALKKNPDRRYQTAGDLAEALALAVSQSGASLPAATTALITTKTSESIKIAKSLVTRSDLPFKHRLGAVLADPLWQVIGAAILIVVLIWGWNTAQVKSQSTSTRTATIIAAGSNSTPQTPASSTPPIVAQLPTNTPIRPAATPSPSPTAASVTHTSTATLTPTPTRTPGSRATNTPSPTVTSGVSPTTSGLPTLFATPVTVTPTPTGLPPEGALTLLDPTSLEEPTYGPTDFEWQWSGPLPPEYGFEVRVWQEGKSPAGVHDALLDNQNGSVRNEGNLYRLSVDITNAPGVLNHRGDYLWTVALVRIKPDYADLGVQAEPVQLRFEPRPKGSNSGEDPSPGGPVLP